MVKLEKERAHAKQYPRAVPPPPEPFPWELVIYVGGAFGVVILLSAGVIYTVVKVYG